MEYMKNEARFLLDSGLLFEINRLVLHKHGLAMVIDIDIDNRRKVKIRGIVETKDADGWLFDQESFEEGRFKYEQFLNEKGTLQLDKRKEVLGFVIQEEAL